MPHCIVEYAKEIEQIIPVQELVSLVHQSVFSSQLFEESSIKTRAIEYKHYQTGLSESPFIHITLKILFGRNHQQKKELTSLVLNKLSEVLKSPISLSVEVVDIEKVSYKKLVR
jgi:5-carboxymethyl-2-hydroxymuconate isomerase